MQVLDKISIIQSAIDLATDSISSCSKADLAPEQEDVGDLAPEQEDVGKFKAASSTGELVFLA